MYYTYTVHCTHKLHILNFYYGLGGITVLFLVEVELLLGDLTYNNTLCFTSFLRTILIFHHSFAHLYTFSKISFRFLSNC